MQVSENTEGCRCVWTCEDADVCKDMGGCRCVGTWVVTVVRRRMRMQMCEDMEGYRCVRTWEDADM